MTLCNMFFTVSGPHGSAVVPHKDNPLRFGSLRDARREARAYTVCKGSRIMDVRCGDRHSSLVFVYDAWAEEAG